MVIASGPGIGNRVVVVDGITGATVKSFSPFEANFTGGLTVAAADIDGDGVDDIIVGADENGGPRLKVVNGATGASIADLFVFEPSFRGGIRVGAGFIGAFVPSSGDVTATDDGTPDIVVGAGIGGGPRIRVLDGVEIRSNRATSLVDFFAFELSLRNGVYVSAGDFSRDGIDDVVVGGGPGGGPRVTVFEAKSLLFNPSTANTAINFFPFDASSRSGVRVAVKNINADSIPDLIVGSGSPGVARVRTFAGPIPSQGSSPGSVDRQDPILIDDDIVFDDVAASLGAWVG
jgi:hypothetical protein